MFKKGDRVKCIHDDRSFGSGAFLKFGDIYTVRYVSDTNVWLENHEGGWLRSRFELDIKYQRKQKINKICLEKVIE